MKSVVLGQNTYGMLGVGSDEWAENTPRLNPDDQLHAVDLVGAGDGYCHLAMAQSIVGGNYFGLLARGRIQKAMFPFRF